jgi:hypothetical protein
MGYTGRTILNQLKCITGILKDNTSVAHTKHLILVPKRLHVPEQIYLLRESSSLQERREFLWN